MRTTIIALFLAFAAGPAHADVPIADNGTSIFKQLERIYQQSGVPSTDDVKGWRSGRCYTDDKPSEAIGMVLIGKHGTVGGGNGPLFPPRSVFFLALAPNERREPAAFDELSLHETDEVQEIERTMESSGVGPAEIRGGALVSDCRDCNLSYQVRKYREYLVVRMPVLASASGYKAGDTHAYCYFFKRLT